MATLKINPIINHNANHFKHIYPIKSLKSNSAHVTQSQETHNVSKISDKYYLTDVSSLAKKGQLKDALKLLFHMQQENVHIGPEFYIEILQGCVYERSFHLGRQIHGSVIKRGDLYARNEYIETKLVTFYAKCDDVNSANVLFGRSCVKNVFSWSAMIGMNSRLGNNEHALLGYSEMIENGVLPDKFVIPNALKACGAGQFVEVGRGIHGYVLKLGFEECVYVASALVDMYGKCGLLDDARVVFDGIPVRNAVVWNSMISGYVQNGMNEEAVGMFYDMRVEGVEPTRVSVCGLLSASANLGAVEEGWQGHAVAVLIGLELGSMLGSSLISFYSKVGWVGYAESVFASMVEKDTVTWNLMISCYVQNGLGEDAVNMCRSMRSEGLSFDCVTMASLFSVCADSGDIRLGKEGHCYSIKNGLDTNVVVGTSIVDMYAKCGEMGYARCTFELTSEKTLVLWNTAIAAYAERGLIGEALKLFYQMQLRGVDPDVISWNLIFAGFFRNGHVNEAKEMFSQMLLSGVEPNAMTWTIVKTGLAENGIRFEAS